jgi:hypothetical protein
MRVKTINPLTYMGFFGLLAIFLFRYLPQTSLNNHIVEYDDDVNPLEEKKEFLMSDFSKLDK